MSDAPIDVLAVIDEASARLADVPASDELWRFRQQIHEARDAVAKLIAAVGPVLQGDMATVRDRLDMQRRLRILKAALVHAGGAA